MPELMLRGMGAVGDPVKAALRTQNLVGYWKLTEASGNAVDASPAGLTLTDTATVTSTTGPGGDFTTARQFTFANSEYFTRANESALQMGDIAQAVCCWFKLDSKTVNRTFVAKGPDGGTSGEYMLYYRQATDRLNFRIWRAGGTQQLATATTFGSPSTGVWYFVMGWYDPTGSTTGNIFIAVNNGTADNLVAAEDRQAVTTHAFTIGATATPALYHDGAMCGVGMWKRLLTATERAWLYNGGTPRSLY